MIGSFFNIGMYRHYYLYMKTLYESILDSDIMDKADKAVELVGQFRDMLSKGMSREYSAANVKKLANDKNHCYFAL